MKTYGFVRGTMIAMACVAGFAATASLASPFGGAIQPRDLRCEYRVDPLGIDVVEPRLSWTLQSGQRGQVQTAYRILVAGDPKQLAGETGDLWDSGKVASDQSIQVPYAGAPLTSGMACYWKVQVWDKNGKPSAWSRPACWTMGFVGRDSWKAQWIGFDASRNRDPSGRKLDLSGAQWIWLPGENARNAAPVATRYFRREFTVPEDRDLASAVCAVAADNGFTMFLNGQQVCTGGSFKEAVTADLAKHVRKGANVVAIEAQNVGDGANPAGVLAMLVVRFKTGKPETIVTDGQWRSSDIAAAGWTDAGFNAEGWRNAEALGAEGIGPWGKVTVGPAELFLPPAQFLRKEFNVEKPVQRATVYASALGNYELHLNGRQVGDAYFAPGWTDYDVRVYYNTFDVTNQLKKGFNTLGGILADGWYSGHIGWGRLRDHYGKDTRFSAQLTIEYTDGSSETILTDKTWTAATGPILEGDFLMGETYDARKEMPGWSTPDFDDAAWKPVDVTDKLAIAIESYPSVLVRKFQEIKPLSVTPTKDGACIYDMGTNFAGFVRLKVQGAEPGRKIVLRFAERLNPDGTIYTTNLRGARAVDTYLCRGDGKEVWQPRFTFHGFQYVEVTGYPGTPGLDAITGIELTSDTPVVGRFACSDAMTNTLYHNVCQTQRANFIEVPTDCPQRDERLGWMGDAQIYVRTATFNTDVSAFFTKWMVDVEDAQLENGGFSDVSPRKVANGGGTAAWGDAGVICPWTIYTVYGDTRILARHYDAMQKWIDYCKGTTKGTLLRPAEGYGDWLSIKADTPKDVLATAYFAHSTRLVAQTAAVLGKVDDARTYHQLFEQIRDAFNKAYVSADGRVKGDTQTVYVLALAFDLLPKEKRPMAAQHLVDNIRDRDWHLSTGFVGTKDLMATLNAIGRTDVAYHLFHNETFPSWGFSIQHGATSIWERWDGWTPEKGFQDPGMNSFAHYSFGAVCEWMFRTIGGIDTQLAPTEAGGPAYKHIVIRPQMGGRLSWAKTSYNSIRGKIATAWKVDGDTLKLDVTIPANTTATVYVPAVDAASIRERRKPVAQAEGVRLVDTKDGEVVLEVGSGVYHFTSRMP
ncbi:MAG TPA: family 78 glycoside hydrolase catalytic domain [Sedimentisphaerales bacterium]|jgi:alpha-L-rhamnosidase|nr:family 78 glycoside hydrolase catalytic domain [Sedimentisphaerales bacterium]HNU27927.1 family 78 glycoside hydrolase catalytic domain [Sedimentisphaerales bacterium]